MSDGAGADGGQHQLHLGNCRFLTAISRRPGRDRWLSQTARRQRKVDKEPLEHADPAHPAEVAGRARHRWGALLVPRHLSWWIALVFMLGAGGFTLGCALVAWPGVFPASLGQPRALTWIFIVGAIFFTIAAALQCLQAIGGDMQRAQGAVARSRWFQPDSLGYWACLIQLAGTLFFNANTLDALMSSLSPRQEELYIWTPNLLGSVCFLLASQLAVMEYAHGWGRFAPRELSWWIVYLNLLGSVLFAVSVAGSFVLPDGTEWAAELANLSTLGGALCFLVAAYLLIPECQEKTSAIPA